MFWKRKKNDFISLGLNTFDEPVAEQAAEPVVEKVEAKPAAPLVLEETKARVVEERPILPAEPLNQGRWLQRRLHRRL
jgi:hypothetical protein